MNKKLKEKIGYVMLFIFVFILPNLFNYYYSKENDKVFYDRVKEDNETCYQRAKQDSVETRWCDEISDAAKLAYRESSRSNNFSLPLLLFSPIVFVLIIALGRLRKQFEELKEKIDV